MSFQIIPDNISDTFPASGENNQILANVNGVNMYTYAGSNYTANDMFPENTGDILGESLPQGSWSGCACLGFDGNIYCSPRSSFVYSFNPYTNTISELRYATGDFIGCCTAYNGKIYFCPALSTFVGILNTTTQKWDNTTISSSIYSDLAYTGANGKFWKCRLAPNGKIYMAPRSANYIGVIDTANDTYYSISISSVSPSLGGLKYNQSALGKNGFLYFFPHDSSLPILKLNINNDTFTTIAQVFPISSYLGAITGPDGNPYGIPGSNATQRIRGINTDNDTFDDSPDLNKTTAFFPQGAQGGILSLQGEIWLPPNSYSTNSPEHIAKYNIYTKTFTYYNIPTLQRPQILRRVGGILGTNGKIYFLPNFEDNSQPDQRVYAFKTGIPSLSNWMIAPEFNNCN